ncbi:hypothetical protein D3C85_1852540 [compost metagenome]
MQLPYRIGPFIAVFIGPRYLLIQVNLADILDGDLHGCRLLEGKINSCRLLVRMAL